MEFWEPIIRRLAGLGTVNIEAATIMTDKVNDFCDVAVVGGGPAVSAPPSAPLKAANRFCLLDKNPVIGGSLNWLGGGEAEKDRLIADLQAQTDVARDARLGSEKRFLTVACDCREKQTITPLAR